MSLIYPDDRILVAIMNNLEDWRRVQEEHWYRIPVKHAPEPVPNIDIIAFYFTKTFGSDKWAIHYFAPIQGHELLTRQDLIPSEPDHNRKGEWYYKFELGDLQHKIPPIISHHWRRITFIVTTGDRFETAEEINDLFENQSPAGRLYIKLKEDGFHPERDWPLKEHGLNYQADLALPLGKNKWLPIVFTSNHPPGNALRFSPESETTDCLEAIRKQLQEKGGT